MRRLHRRFRLASNSVRSVHHTGISIQIDRNSGTTHSLVAHVCIQAIRDTGEILMFRRPQRMVLPTDRFYLGMISRCRMLFVDTVALFTVIRPFGSIATRSLPSSSIITFAAWRYENYPVTIYPATLEVERSRGSINPTPSMKTSTWPRRILWS